jgi:hypothetical protein
MPLMMGLAAVETKVAGAAERGVGAAPPKKPTGREIRRVAAIQARTLGGGQTRKVLRGPETGH